MDSGYKNLRGGETEASIALLKASVDCEILRSDFGELTMRMSAASNQAIALELARLVGQFHIGESRRWRQSLTRRCIG